MTLAWKLNVVGLLPLLLFLCVSHQSSAQGSRSPGTLKGLGGLVIQVHSFGGVPKDAVAKQVESDLRQAGIKLLSEPASQTKPEVARLDLTLTLACAGASCGYTVRLNLSQSVRLIRDTSISNTATTWADGYQNAIAMSELTSLPDLIAVDARTLVKMFIADYLSANR